MPIPHDALLQACQNQDWAEAERLTLARNRIDLDAWRKQRFGAIELYAAYKIAVQKPGYPHMAKEIERVLPYVGRDLLLKAIDESDLDFVAALLDADVANYVGLEAVADSPSPRRAELLDLFIAKRSITPDTALYDLGKMTGACFDRLLKLGTNFDKALVEAARNCYQPEVTNLVQQGWDRNLVKEKTLRRALNAWLGSPYAGRTSARFPHIIHTKLKALSRMAAIDPSKCSGSVVSICAFYPHDLINQGLIEAVHFNNGANVNALLKLGAALDGEVEGHEPIRLAAARGHYHAFDVLVASMEISPHINKDWIDTIAKSAYNGPYQGTNDRPNSSRLEVVTRWLEAFSGTPEHQQIASTLLYQAVLRRNHADVRRFLDHGADPRANDHVALNMAYQMKQEDISRLLLDAISLKNSDEPGACGTKPSVPKDHAEEPAAPATATRRKPR